MAARRPATAASKPHSAVKAATVALLVTVRADSTRAIRSSGGLLESVGGEQRVEDANADQQPELHRYHQTSPASPGTTNASQITQQARKVPATR
jgi:hypothetical protein